MTSQYTRTVSVEIKLEVTTDYQHDHSVAFVIGEALTSGLSNVLEIDSIKIKTFPHGDGGSR